MFILLKKCLLYTCSDSLSFFSILFHQVYVYLILLLVDFVWLYLMCFLYRERCCFNNHHGKIISRLAILSSKYIVNLILCQTLKKCICSLWLVNYQIRGSLSSIRALSKMLSMQVKRSEVCQL